MNTKLIALVAVVALAGCEQMKPDGGGMSALAATSVDVSVSGTSISVNPDPANVGTSNGSIKWTLKNTGSCTYVFPEDGIAFPWPTGVAPPTGYQCSGVGDPATRFRNCGPKQGGTEYHCNAVGTPVRDLCYYYAVKLVSAQANCPTLTRDPWAKNK